MSFLFVSPFVLELKTKLFSSFFMFFSLFFLYFNNQLSLKLAGNHTKKNQYLKWIIVSTRKLNGWKEKVEDVNARLLHFSFLLFHVYIRIVFVFNQVTSLHRLLSFLYVYILNIYFVIKWKWVDRFEEASKIIIYWTNRI